MPLLIGACRGIHLDSCDTATCNWLLKVAGQADIFACRLIAGFIEASVGPVGSKVRVEVTSLAFKAQRRVSLRLLEVIRDCAVVPGRPLNNRAPPGGGGRSSRETRSKSSCSSVTRIGASGYVSWRRSGPAFSW